MTSGRYVLVTNRQMLLQWRYCLQKWVKISGVFLNIFCIFQKKVFNLR